MTSEFYLNALIAYRNLFWPVFVEHDGCVFLAFNERIYKDWIQNTGGNTHRTEMIMNHRHILNLLPRTVEPPTRELVVTFGKLLQEVWEAKLRRDFPGRCFTVSFPTDDFPNLTDYEITFFQTAQRAENSGGS